MELLSVCHIKIEENAPILRRDIVHSVCAKVFQRLLGFAQENGFFFLQLGFGKRLIL